MQSVKVSALLLGAVVCAWAASTANAATLGPGDSDGVIVNSGNTLIDGTFIAPEGQDNTAFNTQLTAATAGYVNIMEPDGSKISDLAWTNSDRQIFVTSDDENGNLIDAPNLAGLTLLGTINEDGTFQDVSSFFGLTGGTLLLASDVSETPIPAGLPLFASGAGLIGLLARKRKRKAAAA